jgi:hypothetical protein
MKTRISAMPNDLKENITAFLSGNVFVTGFTFLKMPVALEDIGWRVLATILIGLAGGFAGLAAKDIYLFAKRWFKKYKKQAP